jgi:hypothetical protein
MNTSLQDLETHLTKIDNKSISVINNNLFLDKTYNLYISKLTLSEELFQKELKQYFKDILDK